MRKKVAVPAGAKFGSWTVLEEVEPKQSPSGYSMRMMRCECKCGRIQNVSLNKLRQKLSKQCLICARVRHGEYHTPEYRAWDAMHQRCYNPNHNSYAAYGARGVHVCERWHRDNPRGLENFIQDMGRRPSAKHCLDKDFLQRGNLCYCPELCSWTTKKEQSRALKSNRMIEFQGRAQCISAWAEELGMQKSTIWHRLSRGWTVEDALTRPVRPRKCKAAS